MDKNPLKIAEADATDFVENSIPILAWTVAISKIMRIPLGLIYFKYPKIARIYFIFEMFINMQEAFMLMEERKLHSQLLLTFLLINWVSLYNFDFKASITSAILYVCVLIYAQSIIYPEDLRTIFANSIPAVITCLIALVFCSFI